MNRNTLSFIALAVSMLFGAGFASVPEAARGGYAAVGGVVVALLWIASGRFGRPDTASPRR
ncbi:hypothetical protein KDN32_08575 [Nocardioides sp. J2M5]|uniref:hypothetical protein n=1 Tax=Nocardioides palaemonis TaxID=2829810 RepID=UPI001BAD3834|nr:hypothetical protein [Nocardioides palaemonis]MBS2937797.1 hypothetical protein [Nocardioides palaemonis]